MLVPAVTVTGPREVEPAASGSAALCDQPRDDGERCEGDGDVDQEHPAPGGEVGEHAAEEDPDGEAEPREGAPDAERPHALGAGRKERGHEGERRRSGKRGADSLERARPDEHAFRLGEAGEQRGQREERRAGEEQPPPAEEVGHTTAEQEQAAEGEHVRIHDPGEAGLREPEVVLDRGQGEVHDRLVQKDHELRRRQHR